MNIGHRPIAGVVATYSLCLLLRVFAAPSAASATQPALSSGICRRRRRQATLISRARGLKDERSTLGCAWPTTQFTAVFPNLAYVESYVRAAQGTRKEEAGILGQFESK